MVKVKSLKSKKSNSSYKLVSKKKSKQSKMGKKSNKSVKSKKRYTGRRKYFTSGKGKKIKNVLKGGDPCEYVKVEGVKLPQLDIPDQLAKLNNDCNSVTSPTGSPAIQHPNIGN